MRASAARAGEIVGGLLRSPRIDYRNIDWRKMTKPVSRRAIIRVDGVVFASGAAGFLETLLAGCGAAPKSSASTSSSASTNRSSSRSSHQATTHTLGHHYV